MLVYCLMHESLLWKSERWLNIYCTKNETAVFWLLTSSACTGLAWDASLDKLSTLESTYIPGHGFEVVLKYVIQYVSSNVHPLTSRKIKCIPAAYTITDRHPNMAEAVYYTGCNNCCYIHIWTITSAISSREACKRNVVMCMLHLLCLDWSVPVIKTNIATYSVLISCGCIIMMIYNVIREVCIIIYLAEYRVSNCLLPQL